MRTILRRAGFTLAGVNSGAGSARLSARSLWCAGAGLCATAAVASVLGKLLITSKQSLPQVLLWGAGLVIVPAVAGAAVIWALLRLFGRSGSGLLAFRPVILSFGVAGVLTPLVVLLLRQDSILAPLVMMVAAALTAVSLNGLGRARFEEQVHEPHRMETAPFSLLSTSNPGIWLALVAAASLEGAAIPFANRELFLGGVLLAGASFVFTWRLVSWAPRDARVGDRAMARVLYACLFAIVTSTFVLMMQMPHDESAGAVRGKQGNGSSDRDNAAAEGRPRGSALGSGYRGIILLAPPKKKERIVAPARLNIAQAGLSNRKRMVIPFDGPYWYFRRPYTGPGRNAHISHGEPM